MKKHNKKHKISTIAPIIFGATLSGLGLVALGASLTSCGNNQAANTISLVTTQKEWTDPTDDKITIELKLAKELTSEYEITGPTIPQESKMSFHNAEFKGKSTISISGTKVTVTTSFTHSGAGAYVSLETVNYDIVKKDTQEVISKATISDFKVNWTTY